MSTGETTCRVIPPPMGSGEPQCDAGTGTGDVAVRIKVDDYETEQGQEQGQDGGKDGGKEERKRSGKTFFAGVSMRLGQRAVDQEHVLRVGFF